MKSISLSINGKAVICPPEASVLEAALTNGIKIPTLCHHSDLKPFGACRLCIVEEENSGRVVAACVTPVAPGMRIQTDSPRIQTHRCNIIRLMMAEHPESCVVCSKGNRCQLRQIAAELDVGQTDLYGMPNYKPLEQANPFIIRDLTKCIMCGKCIRADHELVVVGAIDYNQRGFKSRPAAVHDLPLEQSNCTFCGTCVSICPTGALTAKNTHYVGTPERESFSICGFCAVGCELALGVTEDQVIEVNPSHQKDTVNGATLCVRGHFAHDFLNSDARLIQPMIRQKDEFTPAPWDQALDLVANRLLDIKKKHGPQSVALIGSSKCTNEENYLFQKIARVLLETNNVDNGGYLTGRLPVAVLDERAGGGLRIRSLASLEESEVIVVLGTDPPHSVPVASYFIRRAVRRGVPLLVVDPRRTDLTDFSTIWLPILPHNMLDFLNSLAAILYEKKSYDSSFIERYTEGFSLYGEGLKALNMTEICQKIEVDVAFLIEAAELLSKKRAAFIVGHEILQLGLGVQCMDALMNLSLMTGSLGHKGAGIYLLGRENNEVGAWDMGMAPDVLPGREPLQNDTTRKRWEWAWRTRISPDPGLSLVRMIQEAEKHNLKALYVMGENPLRSLPEPERVRKALENLDLLVVQDILINETTQLADVVLPGAAFSEKAGSFTNLEGRIQSFMPAVSPPGEARPDWEILDVLASKMGYPKGYGSIDKIRHEIAQFVPIYSDLDEERSKTWVKERDQTRPSGSEVPKDLVSVTPVFSSDHKVLNKDYPFTALLGSQRFHLGSGTRTSHSERICNFGLKGEVQISFEDARKLDLIDGDTVRIISSCGTITREIRLDKWQRSGVAFVPIAFNNNDARNLIGLRPLGEGNFLGWTECPVRIEKIGK